MFSVLTYSLCKMTKKGFSFILISFVSPFFQEKVEPYLEVSKRLYKEIVRCELSCNKVEWRSY